MYNIYKYIYCRYIIYLLNIITIHRNISMYTHMSLQNNRAGVAVGGSPQLPQLGLYYPIPTKCSYMVYRNSEDNVNTPSAIANKGKKRGRGRERSTGKNS